MSEVTMTTPSTRPGERCQGGPVLALLSRLQGVTWSLCCHIKHSGSGNNSELNNEIVKLDSKLAVKL